MTKKNFKEIDKIIQNRVIWETQDRRGWFVRFYYNGQDMVLSDIFDTQKEMVQYANSLRTMGKDDFKKIIIATIDAHESGDRK
jgi:hypothetical protein